MRNMLASSRTLFCAAFAAVTLGAVTAGAEPRTHDGFYLNLNAGIGYLSSSVSEGAFDATLKGLTFPSGIHLGGSVIPGLVIGGGLFTDYAPSPGLSSGGQTVSNGVDFSMYLVSIGPFVEFYPDPNDGLHFRAMVGWGALERSAEGNAGGSDPTGLVLSAGGGYDFWVGDEWSIGPMAKFTYAPLSLEGTTFSTIAPSLLANFTYH